MSDTSTIDEPERKIKLQEFQFQRRFLFGCTVSLLIGTILWIIAMSVDRWYIVTGGQGKGKKPAGVSWVVAMVCRLFQWKSAWRIFLRTSWSSRTSWSESNQGTWLASFREPKPWIFVKLTSLLVSNLQTIPTEIKLCIELFSNCMVC